MECTLALDLAEHTVVGTCEMVRCLEHVRNAVGDRDGEDEEI